MHDADQQADWLMQVHKGKEQPANMCVSAVLLSLVHAVMIFKNAPAVLEQTCLPLWSSVVSCCFEN